jgi:MYXO-CTERM domain-containing protein
VFDSAYQLFGTYDGFWDAVRATVTLPAGVAFEDFKVCPSCYSSEIQFSPAAFMAELEKSVIEPGRVIQDLIDAHPTVTRLYSTLSAAEMTVDPSFTFNPDLADVSNVHTAERIIECNPNIDFSEATWRIELPQGGVIRGRPEQVGTWPDAMSEQPANFRILRQGETGDGRVIEDNADTIDGMLDDYNGGVPSTRGARDESDGCAIGPSRVASATPWALVGLAVFALRRRRRR